MDLLDELLRLDELLLDVEYELLLSLKSSMVRIERSGALRNIAVPLLNRR